MPDHPIIDTVSPFPERDGETDRATRIRRRSYGMREAASTDAEQFIDDEHAAPKTVGTSEPAPDTSKSTVANRDVDGPRKASTTPRPTSKLLA